MPDTTFINPPRKMIATDSWDPAEDRQFLSEEERFMRPFTAPAMVTMQKMLLIEKI